MLKTTGKKILAMLRVVRQSLFKIKTWRVVSEKLNLAFIVSVAAWRTCKTNHKNDQNLTIFII